jgi:hypothetical protein
MRREQEAHARRIRRRMFKSLGFHSHFEQETLHEQIIALESFNKEEFRKAAIWLEMLDQRNKDLGFFPVDRFSKVVKGYLRVLAKQSKLIFHRRG